jgi:hypothetical protein
MHSLLLCMCGIGAGTCTSGLLCIWGTQKWTFVYVWCWGRDMHSLPLCMCGIESRRKKWAFVYLGHTKVDICVCVVLGLG